MGVGASIRKCHDEALLLPVCAPLSAFRVFVDSAEFREELSAANDGNLDAVLGMLYMCKDGQDSFQFRRLLSIIEADVDPERRQTNRNSATYIADCFDALNGALLAQRRHEARGLTAE
jgi:hypothetical protein